jgi:hypothetical protein
MCRSHESAIDYGHDDPCIPWRGDFDDYDNPIKAGKSYLPGNRLCGHRDCVQNSHIGLVKPWQALEAERFDTSYKTGKKLDWQTLMAQIQIELPKMSDVDANMTKTS